MIKINTNMNMKRTNLLLMLLAFCLFISAQPISQQEALNRVTSYLKSTPVADRAHRAKQQLRMNPVSVDIPNLYVFDIQGGGYVIASGDERALPVLGYSMSSHMDWDRMPDNMRWWLKGYSQAIEALGDAQITDTDGGTRAGKAAIAPLVTTHWDQDPLYNMLCPRYNGQSVQYAGKSCVTGCVATAMAQVMNYHQWPKEPTTDIPGYSYTVGNLEPQNGLIEEFEMSDLSSTTFDWDNMCTTLVGMDGNTAPGVNRNNIMAVARLMLYCGQSVKMSYSPYISLSYTSYVAQALRAYFGYDKGVRCVNRIGYSINEWENLIYNELANNRPVVYGGQSDDGGHAFVCDGYDGNGMFHINWGWGGYGDDYFSLSVLNPYALNVSGVMQPGVGFCMSQDAVIGIQQPTEGTIDASSLPELTKNANYQVIDMGDYYGVVMSYSYSSLFYPRASFQFDLVAVLPDGNSYKFDINPDPVDVQTGYNYYYYFTISKSGLGFPNGVYKIYPYYICTSVSGGSWQNLGSEKAYYNWVIQNGTGTITTLPSTSGLRISKCAITSGTGEIGTPNDLTLTIRNSGSEYQGTLLLMPVFIGDDDPKVAWNKINSSEEWPEEYIQMDYLMSGAYLKGGTSIANHLTFSFTPEYEGRYLLCLAEQPLIYSMTPQPFTYTSIEISDPTSLNEELRVKNEEFASAVYDLAGRKVNSQLPKGIFIVNGKKVVF